MATTYYKTVLPDILNRVSELSIAKPVVFIGIDGCGASGKSTFAAELSSSLESVAVIHIDDFYKPSQERSRLTTSKAVGWQFDWQRLEREVLTPLKMGSEANYQQYNWKTDCLADWRNIRPLSVLIVEGIYTLMPELSRYFDLRLWIECPRDVRLKRRLKRDGELARSQWEDDWMKEEDKYVASYNPHLQAHKIIQGVPA
jgi:uridine kinase